MIVFVYSGIGTQWEGMGASLYSNNSTFRTVIDEIDKKFYNFVDYSIKDIITSPKCKEILEPDIAHPCIFSIQIALSKLLINENIIPDAIIGHSAGELAGSVIAKILTIDDALKILFAHSELIRKSKNKGVMLFAACSSNTVKSLKEDIEFAAINSVNSCVITGKPESLSRIETFLKNKNIFNKKLNVNVPFHSDIIEKYLLEFEEYIKDIKPQKPGVNFYSSLQGGKLTTPMNSTYWVKHIRNTVNFTDTIDFLIDSGAKVFIEISPHAHLTISIKENIFNKKSSAIAISTMQKNEYNNNIDVKIKNTLKTKNTKKTNKDNLKKLITEEIGEILNRSDINNYGDTSFFELGLNSLNIIKLSEKFNISPVLFFKNPTLNSLINNLFSHQKNSNKFGEDTVFDPVNEADIAVIGMACRLPGGSDTPEKFLEFLKNGKSSISSPPENRKKWLSDKYKAGYLKNNIWEFDNSFFNMPAMESAYLDPQHRLLLETTVEALENGMCTFNEIQEKKTGVFVGISTDDYKFLTFYSEPPNSYAGTGNLFSTASGRLSYFLNLKGPSISIDTACSSSLVAVNYAMESLKKGDIDIAIVAGVNIIILPILFDYFQHVGALSPSYQCRTFDKNADGYARGEGCGVIILKRLIDAEKDGNIIDAVLKSSAVNQDGKTTVLTAPNGESQALLINQALKKAKIAPEKVDFIETHGTGTQLGDSIEVNALGEVFKNLSNTSKKIFLGALKTLTGHLEAAAGIAGLIKAVLLIKEKFVTPNDNFSNPNKFIDFSSLPFALPEKIEKFEKHGKIIAGVSSFGYSGTNAHVVLEEYVNPIKRKNFTLLPYNIFIVSAKTVNSLKKILKQYISFIENLPENLYTSLSFSQVTTRNHFSKRVAFVFKDKTEIIEKIKNIIASDYNLKTPEQNKICFLFPGQGVQYNNMCKELYDNFEAYREPFNKCNEIVRKIAGFDLLELIFSKEENPKIHQTLYTHPIVFSCSYALSEMWKTWGVYPDALLGQSFGEYAVLAVSEILSLEESIKFILERGRLMHSLPPNGKMMTVIGDINIAKKLLNKFKNITIALISSKNNFVVSGDSSEIKEAAEILNQNDMVATVLNISIASHCNLMLPVSEPLEKFGKNLNFKKSTIPIYNNIDASAIYELPPEYFSKQLLSCVHFNKCIQNIINDGINIFIEMGPTSALSNVVKENSKNKNISILQSASKRKNSVQIIFETIKTLYLREFNLNWKNIFGNFEIEKIKLPNYQFDKKIFIPKTLKHHRKITFKREKSIISEQAATHKEIMKELFEKTINKQLKEEELVNDFHSMNIDRLTLYAIVKDFENITGEKMNPDILKKAKSPKDLFSSLNN